MVGYKPINEKHIAIIFPSDSENDYPIIDNEILSLIYYYKENNVNYKMYFCFITDDFIKIINSRYVYGVHVFGHGKVDSLGFQDGIVQYREFKETKPKKEFVAQWHCNHGTGHSLGEYIGKKYYVPHGKRVSFQNKLDIKKLIDNKLKWQKNEND